jgi:MEMO1 family protein
VRRVFWALLLAACSRHGPGETPPRVRLAAVAGSWYPDEAAALSRLVDGMIAGAQAGPEITAPVWALVEPHAGYRYSGRTAAAGYRVVRGETRRRVIVLGPAHRGGFRGASVADVTHYRTPLGDVPLDGEAVARLRAEPLVVARPDEGEHSIEMQIPLLQRALRPGWKLVPVLVGWLEAGDAARLATALRPLCDEDTLVVASGDLTHYGPGYGYQPFPADAQAAVRLRDLDDGVVALLAARDARGLVAYRARTGITTCGFGPFQILSDLLPSDASSARVAYDTSGAQGGDYTNSVSYAAMAFFGPHAPARSGEVLGADEMTTLHALASRAIEAELAGDAGRVRDVAAGLVVGDRLARPAAAFVTLKERGSLRGCMGSFEPHEPLWRAVARAARLAATRDPRFPPVSPEELADLRMEVSVLSTPRPIASWEAFRAGEEGVVLEWAGRQALFLPEVAREQDWGREATLEALCHKAGVPPDAWRRGAKLSVFTSQAREAPFGAEGR